MSTLVVRAFDEVDRPAVIDLRRRCDLTRKWSDPGLDIDRKLARDGGLLLVGFLIGVTGDEALVATPMGAATAIADEPLPRRRPGPAGRRRRCVEARCQARLPKINLQIRTSNLDAFRFSESIGYSMDDVVSMGRRLVDDA
ncbi:MAG: hypothetical protein WKF60_08130 [Ilumatobacter sp.]